MDCYICDLPVEGAGVKHPLLGVRHVNCGKTTKACPVCNMIPCECD